MDGDGKRLSDCEGKNRSGERREELKKYKTNELLKLRNTIEGRAAVYSDGKR